MYFGLVYYHLKTKIQRELGPTAFVSTAGNGGKEHHASIRVKMVK